MTRYNQDTVFSVPFFIFSMFPACRLMTRRVKHQLAIIMKQDSTFMIDDVPVMNQLDVMTAVILAKETNLKIYSTMKNIANGIKKLVAE